MSALVMRQQIRDELAAVVAFDEIERTHLDEASRWIDSGAELCRLEKPATPPKHLVSYFVLIDQEHVLLVDHKNAQRWLPSGGHVEPGEHPRRTVAREMREELGIEPLDPVPPPLMVTCSVTVGLTAGHTDVSLWYVVRGDRRKRLDFDMAEFHSVKWFSFAEAARLQSDPHLGRFIRKLVVQSRADFDERTRGEVR